MTLAEANQMVWAARAKRKNVLLRLLRETVLDRQERGRAVRTEAQRA